MFRFNLAVNWLVVSLCKAISVLKSGTWLALKEEYTLVLYWIFWMDNPSHIVWNVSLNYSFGIKRLFEFTHCTEKNTHPIWMSICTRVYHRVKWVFSAFTEKMKCFRNSLSGQGNGLSEEKLLCCKR